MVLMLVGGFCVAWGGLFCVFALGGLSACCFGLGCWFGAFIA